MNEWISVDDKLPPFGCDVLATDGECFWIAYLEADKDGPVLVPAPVIIGEDFFRATHWMPLPRSPLDL